MIVRLQNKYRFFSSVFFRQYIFFPTFGMKKRTKRLEL